MQASIRMRKLDFRDLEEVEFDRGFAAEDRDKDSDFTFVLVNLVDSTEHVGEWTFDNLDCFANRESGLEFWSLLRDVFLDGVDFLLGKTSGSAASANEASDALGGADGEPRVIVDFHPNEEVSREDFFLDGGLFTFVDFDFFLGGDENLFDEVV